MVIHKTQPIAVHTWDYKAQPNWDKIIQVIDSITKLNQRVKIIEVDTGCDEYAIVIGDSNLTKETAEQAYQHMYDDDFELP